MRRVSSYEGELLTTESRPGTPPRSAASHGAAGQWRLWLTRLAVLIVVLVVWELLSGPVGEFWISRPSKIVAVLAKWSVETRPGEPPWEAKLFFHLGITVQEALLGFVTGSAAGVLVGIVLGQIPFVARVLEPFITAIYSVPKIALAPLFILWFGIGLTSKIIFTAMIVFFLVFWTTYAAVKDVDRDLLDVVRVMGGKRLTVLRKIIIPSSLGWILTGLKVSAPYSVVGAVVGEMIASNRGIGYLIMSSSANFDTAAVFATLFVLMLLATAINQVLAVAEAHFMRWKIIDR